jgi:hypothetical protein
MGKEKNSLLGVFSASLYKYSILNLRNINLGHVNLVVFSASLDSQLEQHQ